MEKRKQKKSIAMKVLGKVALTIFIVNILLIASVWKALDKSLSEVEQRYMKEVLTGITQELGGIFDIYSFAVKEMAEDKILIDFLLTIESDDLNIHTVLDHPKYDSLQRELNILVEIFTEGTILDIGLGSIYMDNFVTNVGTVGSADFSLSTRSYFDAVHTRTTYFSDPYIDHLHQVNVASLAHAISDDSGRVLGILLIDVVIDELGKTLGSKSFGDTGSTYIIDRNYDIIYHPDSSLIGINIIDADFGGDIFKDAVVEATGEIISYTANGVARAGGVLPVDSLSGWKVVSAMDESEFKGPIDEIIYMLILTNIVILIISSFFCVWGITIHLKPLKALEQYVRGVAKGDLHTSFDFESDDEVGQLAEEINICVETVMAAIHHIDVTLMEFGKGNFQFEDDFEYLGDFSSLRQSMTHFVDLMSGSLVSLKGNVLEVGQGAHFVAGKAQALATGSEQQTNSIEGLAPLIDGINQTISHTAENSSSITVNAENINDNLMLSNEKMQDLVQSVKAIKTMSDEVKRIIKAIEDVSFQTNILALNASVEAARAGTSGKGFAVVADEVRNLSLKTSEAVEDTTKIINDIAKAIDAGSKLAQNTSSDLDVVAVSVKRFVENISNISLSTQDQAESISQIKENLAAINTVVHQNSAISVESAAASEELSSQSTVMMESIEQFHLR